MSNETAETNIDIAPMMLQDKFKGKITSIFSNYGSFVQIDYLKKDTGIFIYLGKWIIRKKSRVLLKSDFASRIKANRIFRKILSEGEEVIDIIYKAKEEKIIIFFKDDITLSVFPDLMGYHTEDDVINFFMPDGTVLCYSPLRKFYYEES